MSPSIYWLIASRFLIGIGLGQNPQVITCFVEFLPTNTWYNPIALTMVSAVLGQMGTIWLMMWVYQGYGLRWWIFSVAVPSLFSCAYCLWMPESPDFDIENGNRRRAIETLQYVAKMNNTCLPKGRLVPKHTKQISPTVKELFNKEYAVITILCSILHFTTLFGFYGVFILLPEVISEYGTKMVHVMQNRSLTSDPITSINAATTAYPGSCEPFSWDTYHHSIIAMVGVIPFSFIIAAVVNRMHRQITLAVTFIIFGSMCGLLIISPVRIMATILLLIGEMTIYIQHMMIYIYTAELYPTHIRALAGGVTDAFGRCGAMFTPMVAQWLMAYSLEAALLIYLIISWFSAVLCWFFGLKNNKRVN